MLKIQRYLASVLLLLVAFSIGVSALGNSDVSAAGAVLYCPDTGQFLFEKDADERLSMASTTKIMTALLAVEQNTPDRPVTVTAEMVNVEGTSSGLRAGDVLTLRDIIYCMLLESGNDAANAAAIAIGGSFEGFAELMNRRATEIGMTNTSFVTPSGLDDENHYTTARDMALLASQAIENEDFVRICSAKSYRVHFLSSDKTIMLYNHNRLLESYVGCIGVKTGFTKKSGRCLVSAAERDGVRLIAVTLNAPNDWNDHQKLLDSGFDEMALIKLNTDFSRFVVSVVGGEQNTVAITGSESVAVYRKSDGEPDVTRTVYLEKFLYAPVNKGDIIGYAVYETDGRTVKRLPLTAAQDIPIAEKQQTKQNFLDRLFGLFNRW